MAGMDPVLGGGGHGARNVQTRFWHSATFFLLLLRLRLLLSPAVFSKATEGRVYTLGCEELNYFILPGKTELEHTAHRERERERW